MKYCLHCSSSERVLMHKETCLKIIGKQNVKLTCGSIKFKNHFKHLDVSFKIYADFKSIFKEVKSNDTTSYTQKYQQHIPFSFAYKVVCIDDKFSKSVVFYRGKMQFIDLLKQFLRGMIIAKML